MMRADGMIAGQESATNHSRIKPKKASKSPANLLGMSRPLTSRIVRTIGKMIRGKVCSLNRGLALSRSRRMRAGLFGCVGTLLGLDPRGLAAFDRPLPPVRPGPVLGLGIPNCH